MHIVLLSGGSGKRLWPLSNEVRSKQFLKLFRTEDGQYESMAQRVYRQIKTVDPTATVTIATSKSQVSAIYNQLGERADVCVEPCRRDTFPAIALASAYLHDVRNVGREEAVAVCPVDAYVDETYFAAVEEMTRLAQQGGANLTLMGIEPTYPSEKYGYILPACADRLGPVQRFVEKPCAELARQYIEKGALWNGGVFAFRLGYLLDRSHELLDYKNYADLYARYENYPSISMDYALAEKEQSIQVIRFTGRWMDLGTWNTLTEVMQEQCIGDVRMNDRCENVHVINELNVPILCMGLKNLVVCASPEGILVSDKEQSSRMKPFVDDIHQQVMFAEKSWGSFTVLDVEEESLTIKITLLPSHRLHYHSHAHRDETWTVVSGEGLAVLDDAEIPVQPGTMLRLPAGCRHTIIARTPLTVIEVQMGKDISVVDKVKYSLEKRYGRHR